MVIDTVLLPVTGDPYSNLPRIASSLPPAGRGITSLFGSRVSYLHTYPGKSPSSIDPRSTRLRVPHISAESLPSPIRPARGISVNLILWRKLLSVPAVTVSVKLLHQTIDSRTSGDGAEGRRTRGFCPAGRYPPVRK